ncbi:response regulator [Sphingopyxis yananensis]|uniref:response regulator n=1 Tax=Sphingopyxis yananensis TaxID=2886687 RepID=UPI001D10A023|nr:response regulator [Sphingopyxis yananensis]MCC2603364.1 response regulator [Sphingopyxis yananensis]
MSDKGRILVVEDDVLIGMLLGDMFEALEYDPPAQASNNFAALEILNSESIVGALVDINLGGEKGWPVAAELTRRGIQFAFTTGGGTEVPEAYRHIDVVTKPFRLKDIEAVVESFRQG